MGTLYKRTGTKFWWMGYRDEDDRWRYVSSERTTKKDARDVLAKTEAEIAERRAEGSILQRPYLDIVRRAALSASKGELTKAMVRALIDSCVEAETGERPKVVTVEQWFNQWMDEAGKKWSASTRVNTERHVKAWRDALGRAAKRPLGELGYDEIRSALEAFKGDQEAKLGMLRRCLGFAMARQMIFSNPAATRVLKADDQKRRLPAGTFSDAELDLLEGAALAEKTAGKEWHGCIIIARSTGLRFADVRTLRWEEVCLPEMEIRREQTKTGKFVKTPVGRSAKWLLANRRKSGEVFPVLARMDKGKASTIFSRIMRRAGVSPVVEHEGEQKRRSFHSLRHGVASKLYEAEVDERTSKEIVGHQSTAVHRRYSHGTAKQRREAAKKAGL